MLSKNCICPPLLISLSYVISSVYGEDAFSSAHKSHILFHFNSSIGCSFFFFLNRLKKLKNTRLLFLNMLYRTAVNGIFEYCSKITFVPTIWRSIVRYREVLQIHRRKYAIPVYLRTGTSLSLFRDLYSGPSSVIYFQNFVALLLRKPSFPDSAFGGIVMTGFNINIATINEYIEPLIGF